MRGRLYTDGNAKSPGPRFVFAIGSSAHKFNADFVDIAAQYGIARVLYSMALEFGKYAAGNTRTNRAHAVKKRRC